MQNPSEPTRRTTTAAREVFRSSLRGCLRDVCSHKDCFLAEAWFPKSEGEGLEGLVLPAVGEPVTGEFEFGLLHCSKHLVMSTKRADGVPGSTQVTTELVQRYAPHHTLSLQLCRDAAQLRDVDWCLNLEEADDHLLARLKVRLGSAVACPVVRDGQLFAVIVLYSRLTEPSTTSDGLSAYLVLKVNHVARALDWINGKTLSRPSTPRPHGKPKLVPSTGRYQTLQYDSHTLTHTSDSLQSAVKMCVSSVCGALQIDGAEAWFALPNTAKDDMQQFTYSYLVVSQRFQRQFGNVLAYPPDLEPSRHQISTSMCEGVNVSQNQVWWPESALTKKLLVPVKTVIGVPVILDSASAGAQVGESGLSEDSAGKRVVSVMIFFSTKVIPDTTQNRIYLEQGARAAALAAVKPPEPTSATPALGGKGSQLFDSIQRINSLSNWRTSGLAGSPTSDTEDIGALVGLGLNQSEPRVTHAGALHRSQAQIVRSSSFGSIDSTTLEVILSETPPADSDVGAGQGSGQAGPAAAPSITRSISQSSQQSTARDVMLRATRAELLGGKIRRGKWTSEETGYAEELIQQFQNGLLEVEEGTTLRRLLAQELHCDPMRITKKFTKDSSIGKQVYKRSETATAKDTSRAKDRRQRKQRLFYNTIDSIRVQSKPQNVVYNWPARQGLHRVTSRTSRAIPGTVRPRALSRRHHMRRSVRGDPTAAASSPFSASSGDGASPAVGYSSGGKRGRDASSVAAELMRQTKVARRSVHASAPSSIAAAINATASGHAADPTSQGLSSHPSDNSLASDYDTLASLSSPIMGQLAVRYPMMDGLPRRRPRAYSVDAVSLANPRFTSLNVQDLLPSYSPPAMGSLQGFPEPSPSPSPPTSTSMQAPPLPVGIMPHGGADTTAPTAVPASSGQVVTASASLARHLLPPTSVATDARAPPPIRDPAADTRLQAIFPPIQPRRRRWTVGDLDEMNDDFYDAQGQPVDSPIIPAESAAL